jgi:hypothetical protein
MTHAEKLFKRDPAFVAEIIQRARELAATIPKPGNACMKHPRERIADAVVAIWRDERERCGYAMLPIRYADGFEAIEEPGLLPILVADEAAAVAYREALAATRH